MTAQYATSADGTSIAYERKGNDDRVVVLVEPPLHHRAMSAYADLVPLLAEALTVVTYDRRGRGESADGAAYHPDRESEDLDAVIDAVGGFAGVYGYSAGALLALRAASGSHRIGALVVLEPPIHDDSDPRPDPLTVELAELLARNDRDATVHRFHEAIGVPDEFIAELAGSAAWRSMVAVAHTAVYDCMISDAVDRDLLARINTPTLVLDSNGSSDDLAGWAASIAAHLPNADHLSLPGEWHTVADDVLAPVIIDHITKRRDARSPWEFDRWNTSVADDHRNASIVGARLHRSPVPRRRLLQACRSAMPGCNVEDSDRSTIDAVVANGGDLTADDDGAVDVRHPERILPTPTDPAGMRTPRNIIESFTATTVSNWSQLLAMHSRVDQHVSAASFSQARRAAAAA